MENLFRKLGIKDNFHFIISNVIVLIGLFAGFPCIGQDFLLTNIDEPMIMANGNQFVHLFDSINSRSFNGVKIKYHDSVVFVNIEPFSETRFEKTPSGQFNLFVVCSVPIESKWEKLDALRYSMKLDSDIFSPTVESNFSPKTKLSKDEIQELLTERKKILDDNSYTSKDWYKIPQANSERLVLLCGRLFLCALNGNHDCHKNFIKLPKDFNVMQAGYLAETYTNYEQILKLKY